MAKTLALFLLLAMLGGCSSKNKNLILAEERAGGGAEDAEVAEEIPTDPQELFLYENAQKPDIIVRPSGLQIRVIKKGTGDIPTSLSQVTVNYHGTLIDGTVFDTTRDEGQPFTFPVTQVIDGWEEALYLMQEGAIYQLFIPAKLAYGDVGAGTSIPPGATLIFEVELLNVQVPLKGDENSPQ